MADVTKRCHTHCRKHAVHYATLSEKFVTALRESLRKVELTFASRNDCGKKQNKNKNKKNNREKCFPGRVGLARLKFLLTLILCRNKIARTNCMKHCLV